MLSFLILGFQRDTSKDDWLSTSLFQGIPGCYYVRNTSEAGNIVTMCVNRRSLALLHPMQQMSNDNFSWPLLDLSSTIQLLNMEQNWKILPQKFKTTAGKDLDKSMWWKGINWPSPQLSSQKHEVEYLLLGRHWENTRSNIYQRYLTEMCIKEYINNNISIFGQISVENLGNISYEMSDDISLNVRQQNVRPMTAILHD